MRHQQQQQHEFSLLSSLLLFGSIGIIILNDPARYSCEAFTAIPTPSTHHHRQPVTKTITTAHSLQQKRPLYLSSTSVTSSSSTASSPSGDGEVTDIYSNIAPPIFDNDDHDDDDPTFSADATTLRSMTFSNLEKSQQPQLLCDFLMELGACSTSITDADRDTPQEQSIFAEPGELGYDKKYDYPQYHLQQPQQQDDSNAAVICGDHAVGRNVWNRCNVQAQFPNSIDLTWIADLVQESLPDIQLQPYGVTPVPNRDWVVHVQQSWKPILVSSSSTNIIILRFPWHTDEDVQEVLLLHNDKNTSNDDEDHDTAVDVDNVVELQLEGGAAFGTGEHPTTQLCLSWLQETIEQHQQENGHPIQKVIDYGAGSGVLGMAACTIVAKQQQQQEQQHNKKKDDDDDDRRTNFEAIGVDIDIDAVQIANTNAKTNDVRMKNYLPPLEETTDSESKSVLMKAHAVAEQQKAKKSTESDDDDDGIILPKAYNGPIYDACVANILAGPLVTLAPTLASLTKPGGKLGLSGILARQAESVVSAYTEFFENVTVEKELNGWVLISGTRKEGGVKQN